MKELRSMAESFLGDLKQTKSILCDHISGASGPVATEFPFSSSGKTCEWCGGTDHMCPFVDPKISASRTWLCLNPNCVVYRDMDITQRTGSTLIPQRRIEWPLFCEFNGIGDANHDVRFEKVDQSVAKIDYMLKFVKDPHGILHMQGPPGIGKTYAAMAMCELFTRKEDSCIFVTQTRMRDIWLDKEKSFRLIERWKESTLLVIDDFGTTETSPAFLAFFMELINCRIQWKRRGTVITTNLDSKTFSSYCGDALADRINTGQLFVFKGSSRRKPAIL